MTLIKRQVTKLDKASGKKFYAKDFAYVPDPQKPSTWKYRLTNVPGGKPAAKRLMDAIKAISTNMTTATPNPSSTYYIPPDALESVLDKLREAWMKAFPNQPVSEMDAMMGHENDDSTGEEDPAAPPPGVGEEDSTTEDDPAAEEDPMAEEDPAGEVDPAAAAEEDDEEDPSKKPKAKKPAFKALRDAVLKYYIDPYAGAKTFTEVLTAYAEEKKQSEVMNAVWPLISALDTSLRSIIADREVEAASKQTMMRSSVEGFLAGIKTAMPEVEEVLEKALAIKGVVSMTTKATAGAGDDTKKALEDLAAKLDAITKERDAAQAEAATAKAVASLSVEEKAHYDKAKAEDQPKFLALDKAARAEAIRKAAAGEETLTVDGVVVRKSEIGDGVFSILKAQQAKIVETEKQVSVEKGKRVDMELRKRAQDELTHLPGTEDEKVEMLKAIEAMPEAQQKSMLAALKATNEANADAFKRLGAGGKGQLHVLKGGTTTALSAFNKRVSELKSANKGMSHQEAMRQARLDDPEGFAAYQQEGVA